MEPQAQYSELSDGTKIPRLGYGTSRAENLENILEEAINIGYRHIDTAAAYDNEVQIGNAIKKAITGGQVKREDLFVTTKFHAKKENAPISLEKSLRDLQLDYVDLYLIHWPCADWDKETQTFKQPPLHVTWKQMEDLVRAGKCRAIGVSNFNVQLLVDLLSYAEIKPVCNQIEVHPYLVQEDLINFCKKNRIEVTAYCPLGRAILGNSETGVKNLTDEPIIQELAAKYSKTPTQMILSWHLSRGYVIIPRTSNFSRLKENFESSSFKLTDEDIKKINTLNKNARVCDAKDMDHYGFTPIFA